MIIRKNIASIVVLSIIMIFAIVSLYMYPFLFVEGRSIALENNQGSARTWSVYVDGAVSVAGVYVVNQTMRITEVINIAGYLSVSNLASYGNTLVNENEKIIIVPYIISGVTYYPVNVNSKLFAIFAQSLSICNETITLIDNYKANNGKIMSKQHLREIIDNDLYDKHYYKMYVEYIL